MIYPVLVDLRIDMLRRFGVLAEELNVTRAAARLHLTQPDRRGRSVALSISANTVTTPERLAALGLELLEVRRACAPPADGRRRVRHPHPPAGARGGVAGAGRPSWNRRRIVETEEVGMERDVTFARDIRPLFRDQDVRSMSFSFDLSSYDDVRANAEAIYARLEAGEMPCDAGWPPTHVERFRAWMDSGFPA